MDIQIFLNDLKKYAKNYSESPEGSKEFFNYLDSHYKDYIYANQEEYGKARKFIKGGLFHSSQIPHALLMYVKEWVLPNLKSTGDDVWLRRGLVAISMENFSGKFDDPVYVAYPMKGDCTFLLADLYVTAEEKGINSKAIFGEIANISDDNKASFRGSMKEFLAGGGDGKLVHERRTHGKFVAMF